MGITLRNSGSMLTLNVDTDIDQTEKMTFKLIA